MTLNLKHIYVALVVENAFTWELVPLLGVYIDIDVVEGEGGGVMHYGEGVEL